MSKIFAETQWLNVDSKIKALAVIRIADNIIRKERVSIIVNWVLVTLRTDASTDILDGFVMIV